MKMHAEAIVGADGIRAFAEAPFGIRENRFHPGAGSVEWTSALLAFPFGFERGHWVVRDAGKIVGRIGANVSATEPSRGMIGFYECALDHPARAEIHGALLSAAEAWLKERGVKTAYGPVDYQTWFPYRFRTFAEPGTPDFGWEPLQPDAYTELWRSSGFTMADRYSSRCTPDLPSIVAATESHHDRCVAAGFRARPFRVGKDFAEELPFVQDINRKSFQSGFLTEPIDPRAYDQLYVPQFASVDMKYCLFTLNPEGKEIGYFFAFGDQDHFIVKTVATATEYQKHGVGAFGLHVAMKMAVRDGFEFSIAALVKERAQSEGLVAKASNYVWAHEYGVFKKDF